MLAVGIQVTDLKCVGEVLSQLVRSAHLKGLPVAHHGLTGHRVDRAGEPFGRGLAPDEDWHRELVDHEVGVDVQHDTGGIGGRVCCGGVRGVALLPQEFGGPQEKPRPQLPPHHVRPLVQQQRQITVALHPLAHVLADDRLRGRPNHHRFLELLTASTGDQREFRTEPFDVLGLAL